MKTIKKMFICLMAFPFLIGCKKSNDLAETDFIEVAFNEQNIPTVTIGNQVWMAENLKVTVDSHGNRLGCVSYKHDDANAEIYGRLYSWAEAVQACPPGWHLPTIEEWQALFDFLGGTQVAGGKMKTVEYWESPNVGATNSSGFSAVPAGGSTTRGGFEGMGWATHFWSSSDLTSVAQMQSLMNSYEDVYILIESKTLRISVRYLKN